MNTFFNTLLTPRASDEDARRREFILNILLLCALALFSTVSVIAIAEYALAPYNGLSPLVLTACLVLFVGLYALSRMGRARLAARIFVMAFFLLPAYASYRWGVDLPSSILFEALFIIMAGVLLSTRAAFLATGAVCIMIATIGYLHAAGAVAADRYWAEEPWGAADIALAGIGFFIIAGVSWLSNREIERSLARARRSEALVAAERDLLEARVKERTDELKRAELERLEQAYRFVEFGRVAAGFLHDLTNPLTAVSLNIRKIADSEARASGEVTTLREDIDRAKRAADHMQTLLAGMRRHLAHDEIPEAFCVRQAMLDTVRMLEPYARGKQVVLVCNAPTTVTLYGIRTAFMQALGNLLSNGIESYDGMPIDRTSREVIVTLESGSGAVTICIRDFGSGIAPDALNHLFEPFFSTKNGKGLGLGLSLSRRIIEKAFTGTMHVTLPEGGGTLFKIYLPL